MRWRLCSSASKQLSYLIFFFKKKPVIFTNPEEQTGNTLFSVIWQGTSHDWEAALLASKKKQGKRKSNLAHLPATEAAAATACFLRLSGRTLQTFQLHISLAQHKQGVGGRENTLASSFSRKNMTHELLLSMRRPI